jgi:hypothetical protein
MFILEDARIKKCSPTPARYPIAQSLPADSPKEIPHRMVLSVIVGLACHTSALQALASLAWSPLPLHGPMCPGLPAHVGAMWAPC